MERLQQLERQMAELAQRHDQEVLDLANTFGPAAVARAFGVEKDTMIKRVTRIRRMSQQVDQATAA